MEDEHYDEIRPDEVPATRRRSPAALWAVRRYEDTPDPVASLPPTAQRLVNAATRVVSTQGFAKLTLQRIAAESGENVAAVRYYFGNKAGLISTLIDAAIYAGLATVVLPAELDADVADLSQLADETLSLSLPTDSLRVLFEVLPHALRDADLRPQLLRYYESYFELHLDQLSEGQTLDPERRERHEGFAMLLTAIADGLTIQTLVSPKHFDVVKAIVAFDALLAKGSAGLLGDLRSPSEDLRDAEPTQRGSRRVSPLRR